MATHRKLAGKAAKPVKAKVATPARKVAKARPVKRKAPVKPVSTAKRASARVATAAPAKAAKVTAGRSTSAKTAAQAVAAARAGVPKRRAPSYIPRSRFSDDWLLAGPVELPRQPNPAAHTPTRKPPKPRAPKPKAISHEQAVANLKALLESRKRKERNELMAGKSA